MSSSITRIQAEADMRQLAILAASHSEKGFREAQEGLRRELGQVVREAPIYEPKKLGALMGRLKTVPAPLRRGGDAQVT